MELAVPAAEALASAGEEAEPEFARDGGAREAGWLIPRET
jgi:hypothetical protein